MFKFFTKSNPTRALVLLFFIVLQFQNSAIGQETRIDSLRNELSRLKPILDLSLRDSIYVNVLNDLAFKMRHTHSDSLRKLSEEALRYSKTIGYARGEIESYIHLGNYQSDRGNHQKGLELISKALDKSRDYKLSNLELRAISNISIVHDYLDKNELAFKEMLLGIDIATELDNKRYLSLFNMNIGVLYLSLSEYPEALNYFKTAKKFGDSYGDEMISAYIHSNLAGGYNHVDKPKTGLYYINEAIATLEKKDATDWLAYAYTIKGKSYLQQGDYTSALHWFKRSEKLYQTIEDERSEIILSLAMAKNYLYLEKDSMAQVHAKKTYDLSETYKDKWRKKNASELLYTLSKKKGDLAKSFKYLEIFQHLSDSLAQDESKKSMLMFQTQMDYEKQKQDLIETNEKSLTKQTNIIAAIVTLLLILTGFIFMILRNHKIQKKLNQELKKSESELIEINATKNKLFSIISHDLRGPIIAFSKLIELFSQQEIEKEQFMSLMPKVENDIKYISFTLNNLLSWCHTQKKGIITKPVLVNIDNIVTANINLLSEIARNKSIKILNTVKKSATVWSDQDQVDVVIRNLISNALKFTPKNGSVTISAVENNQNWEVSIQDTGVGMNQQSQNKIFEYNSNTTTYGTDNEKGTGLGLNLCKELIEKNKGAIWVNSTQDHGARFTFSLPKP